MTKCPHCNGLLEISISKALNENEIRSLVDSIDESQLTGKAADFVAQTKERFEKYRETTRISDQQRGWLEDLARQFPANAFDPSITDEDIPF